MIDLSKYSWLTPRYPLPETEDEKREFQQLLKAIEKKESQPAMRNLYANYYLDQMQKGKEEGKPWKPDANLGKELRSWGKSQSFKKAKETFLNEDKAKFQLTGIVIIISGTLVLYFLRAVLAQEFVINFSVDAIVGALALVFIYRGMRNKIRLLKSYDSVKDYVYLDVASFVLCVLLKMWIPPMFDVSLVVLFISYFIQSRRFQKYLKAL